MNAHQFREFYNECHGIATATIEMKEWKSTGSPKQQW
jgi:hypothetical protein